MNLENTFYVMGIVFMILMIGVLVAISILIYYIKKQIDSIHDTIQTKIDQIGDAARVAIPTSIGPFVVSQAFGLLRKMIFKRK